MKCITGLEVKLFKGVSCDMFAMSALSNMLRNIDTAKSGHVDYTGEFHLLSNRTVQTTVCDITSQQGPF
jgi:hypothetical protein